MHFSFGQNARKLSKIHALFLLISKLFSHDLSGPLVESLKIMISLADSESEPAKPVHKTKVDDSETV